MTNPTLTLLLHGTPARRSERAFTMVELLAAVALAALVMTLLVAVGKNLTRTRLAVAQRATNDWSGVLLLELLRHDLAHAQSVETKRNEVIITGFGGLDRAGLTPTHKPARVTYRLAPQAGSPGERYLLREQVELNNIHNQNTFVELVAAGVSRFELQGEMPGAGSGEQTGSSLRGGAWARVLVGWGQSHELLEEWMMIG